VVSRGMANPRVRVDNPRAEGVLLDALRGRARGNTEMVRVTPADAVALTGLPSDEAEPALRGLAKTYRSHLAVTDDGDLVYAFDPNLERRDAVPFSERLRRAAATAYRGFQVFFKVWIAVTLVVYVAAFVAMAIAMMFSRGDDRDDDRGGGGLGWLWLWFWPNSSYGDDPYGRRVVEEKPKKAFHLAVFDFVFGPTPATPADARSVDRRILAFLRDQKGRITASELSALTGISLDEASEELTRMMAEYDGEVDVTDEGTLIYRFEGLLSSASAVGTSWSWAWDQTEERPTLTGNTGSQNALAGGLAGFNLLASLLIGPAFLQRLHLEGGMWQFWVVLFPLIFSTVFFAIPAARLWKAKREDNKRETRRIRRELMREVWRSPGDLFDPAAVAAVVAARVGAEPARVSAVLEKLLVELDGDVETDGNGAMRYTFPRLVEEQKGARAVRATLKEMPRLGPVVFSSESEDLAN